MDAFTSNEEEALNDSQSRIPFYRNELTDISYEIRRTISPHAREMSINEGVPNLVPENVPIPQQSDSGNATSSQDVASGSENFNLLKFSETFGSSCIYNRKRNMLIDSRMSDINKAPELSLTNEGKHVVHKLEETQMVNFGENTASNINITQHFQNETTINVNSNNDQTKGETEITSIPENPGPLSICFICKGYIFIHSRRQKGKQLYKCCCCEYITGQQTDLMTHIGTHNIDPFFCNVCGETFKEKLSHDTDRTCKVCNENFECKTFLLEHLLLHKSVCPICWKKNDEHISEPKEKNLAACCYCKKEFHATCKLHVHFLTHFREKAYRCNECGKRFKQKHSLNAHKNLKHK